MADGTFDIIKASIYCKASEILLTVLLCVAISVFAYTLKTQAHHAERLRNVETSTALNKQIIENLKEMVEKGDEVLLERIDNSLESTNKRFDTLENLINLAISGKIGD